MNPSYAFEIEKLHRAIDNCNDVNELRARLKEMIRLHYTMKDTMVEMMKSK